MSSKTDFLHWDGDIDLDYLFEGDFTDLDHDDLSDDEPSKPTKAAKSSLPASKPMYCCPSCLKELKTITGFRGHMRTQHNIKPSDHRVTTDQNSKTVGSKQNYKFKMSETDYDRIFDSSFTEALNGIINCPFRNSSASSNGQVIIDLAKTINNNSDSKAELKSVIHGPLWSIFSSHGDSTSEMIENEEIFSTFYITTIDPTFQDKCLSVINSITATSRFSSVFLSVLLRGLLDQIISNKVLLLTSNTQKTSDKVPAINDSEQCTLFYISGYIISALKKESARFSTSAKHKALGHAISACVKENKSAPATFVDKYSVWTAKLNRGGLQTPCDNFFLMVREFELILRQECDTSLVAVNSLTLDKQHLKELIISAFMVKNYFSKLCFDPIYSGYILERIISLYLNIRGHAVSQQIKAQFDKNDSNSKPLRKVLQDKTNM